jgi:hypothetical protein
MIQDERIDKLLKEFEDHRTEIKKMIAEVEDIRAKIKELLPENLEYRYKMLFEERVKTIVTFFQTILDMRKEITKSIKDELELRRRIGSDDEEVDLEQYLNVSEFAQKVDEMRRKKDKIIESTEGQNLDPLVKELDIDIPGFNIEEEEHGEVKEKRRSID